MCKKIQRILCLLLLLTLVGSFALTNISTAVTTANNEGQEISQLAADVYKASLAASHRHSFYGYCGTMVSWELKMLGITTNSVFMDGRDTYDYFKNQTTTSGGFPVTPYSSSHWTIYSALYHITEGGTKNAYNIMVGFERTPSADGSRYGHCLVIFGIVDGIVYYNESGPTFPNGEYYPEGTTIAVTIQEFSEFYSYATFDGLIHFGRRSYTENCTQYPAYLFAATTEAARLYTQPCLPEADERSSFVREVQVGENLSVTGLYLNPLGEYWYQVQEDNGIGYIPASQAQVTQMCYDDVVIYNENFPQELRQGRNHAITGDIYVTHNRLTTVRAQLFAMDGTEPTHVLSTTQSVDARRLLLSHSDLVSALGLPKLKVGTYRLELAAVVGNYYYADGALQTQWKTIKVWRSDFQVVPQSGSTYQVRFDANGGTVELNETSVFIGDRLPQLPQATRPGFVFAGWFTEDGVEVTERTVIAGSMTLRAHWNPDSQATGWYQMDGQWVYLLNGSRSYGFVNAGGSTCYITDKGAVAKGWQRIRDRIFYFLPSGAMYLGWMETEEGLRYFTANGAAVGSLVIEDMQFFFDDLGFLQTSRKMR